jgi:hypothetical protein
MKETGKTAKQVSIEVHDDYHENQRLLLRMPREPAHGIPKPKSLEHLASKKMTRPEYVTDELIQTIDQLVIASVKLPKVRAAIRGLDPVPFSIVEWQANSMSVIYF